MQDNPAPKPDAFAALRLPNFRILIFGRLIAQLGEMMVSIAVGWELYERTSDTFILGMVGLVQIIPIFLFALPAGYIVDRYNRKNITLISQVVLVICSALLAVLSITQSPLPYLFVVLAVIGAARAFNNPAEEALTPLVVSGDLYQNAVTWSTSTWQAAAIFGPALGGLIIGITNSAAAVYFINAVSGLVLITALLFVKPRAQTYASDEETPIQSLLEGMRFLRNNQIILASITLDMFAVLLGGAVYLLPVFAKDILHTDATGLGILRAGPAIGALCMGWFIANSPPFTSAGKTLLWAVVGFGAATILFGISTSFLFSLAMLFAIGALDYISVVIRHTLVMTFTPDDMRGRVSSVNTIFIGASNELGGFRAGAMASFLGPIGAVVFGGVGTIAVVAIIAKKLPELVELKRLTKDSVSPAELESVA